MQKVAGIALFIVLFSGMAYASLPSETVKKIAQYYSTTDEAVVIPSENNPLTYKDQTFHFAYFTPQDTQDKTLLLVIRQVGDGGVIETDLEIAKVLYGLDYDFDTLKQMKERSISFEDLKNVVDSLKFQIENVETPIIDNIKRQSDVDMIKIDDTMFEMSTAIDDSSSAIQEGIDAYDSFKNNIGVQDISEEDLSEIFKLYNVSISSVQKFIGKSEKYQKAISDTQIGITEPTISTELAKLGNLKVKDSVLKSYNASLALRKRELDLRFLKKAKLISDSIDSMLFRKALIEAQKAYESSTEDLIIESLLSVKYEQSLKDCKLSSAELKKKWDAINAIMNQPSGISTSDYNLVPGKIIEAKNMALNLKNRLTSCNNATPTTSKKPTGMDYGQYAMPVVIGIILVLLLYYLSGYMKKPMDG